MLPKRNLDLSGTMIGFLLVSLSLVLVVKSSAEVDWCSPSLSCTVKDQVYQHTMCLYKNQTRSPHFKNISNVQTYPGRFELLKKHNQLREMVATGMVGLWPAASAMRKLSYDNVLEKIAFRWATQCSAGHDDCRKTKRWPVVGQNVFELARDFPIDYKMWNPASVVDDWFRDIYVTKPGNYSGEDVSFAQMIHDKTEKVGCADVAYEVVDSEDLKPRYRRLIVCNYGPGVEPGTSQLYEEGPTCGKCPTGIRCLCGGRVLGHQESSTIETTSTDDVSSPTTSIDVSSLTTSVDVGTPSSNDSTTAQSTATTISTNSSTTSSTHPTTTISPDHSTDAANDVWWSFNYTDDEDHLTLWPLGIRGQFTTLAEYDGDWKPEPSAAPTQLFTIFPKFFVVFVCSFHSFMNLFSNSL